MFSEQTDNQIEVLEQTVESKEIIKINYKKLYQDELKRRKNAEISLEKKNNELAELKTLLKSKEEEIENNKVKLLSYTNSETAKNGYKEEELVCKDLNNEIIKQALMPILGNEYDECSTIPGKNHKSDIQSTNNIMKGQVKKYKKGQFQQLDRHWISDFLKNVPELNDVSQILKDLFEYPLLPDGKCVDKGKSLKKLCDSNYSQEELNNFLGLLNKYKKKNIRICILWN